jgi:prevent-host-death family protein
MPTVPATVKIAEMKAHLSEWIARAEAGEEVVITRGNRPVARLAPLGEKERAAAAFEAMIAERDLGCIKPVTMDELIAWKHEGHRY